MGSLAGWFSGLGSLGWYDDPIDPAMWRYWNGYEWTTRTSPKFAADPSKLEARRRLCRDLALFVGFSFVFALIPIGKHVVELLGKSELHSGWDIFSSGELTYIAGALAWVSVGDFLKKRDAPLTTLQLLIVGLSGALLFVEGWLWTFVGSGQVSSHPAVVGYLCIGPFAASLAIVAGILLVEREEGHR